MATALSRSPAVATPRRAWRGPTAITLGACLAVAAVAALALVGFGALVLMPAGGVDAARPITAQTAQAPRQPVVRGTSVPAAAEAQHSSSAGAHDEQRAPTF
jgi:hypothetical protein